MLNGTVQISMNAKQEVCLNGRIDLNNVVATLDSIKALIATQPEVRIDLAGIESADSSSLALLIECIRYAKCEQKTITLCNVPRFMLDLGRVCGLDSILPINKPLVFH